MLQGLLQGGRIISAGTVAGTIAGTIVGAVAGGANIAAGTAARTLAGTTATGLAISITRIKCIDYRYWIFRDLIVWWMG